MNQLISKKIKKQKNNKGFTLIELIVVIAILAILAAIAIPRFGNVQDGAAKSAHNANVATLESAANLYIASVGATEATGKTHTEIISKGFLKAVPNVPKGIVVGTTTYDGTTSYSVGIAANGVVTVTPAALP